MYVCITCVRKQKAIRVLKIKWKNVSLRNLGLSSGWQGVRWHCTLSLALGTWSLDTMPSVGKPGTCKGLDIALNDNGWSIPGSLRWTGFPAFRSLVFSPLWKIVLYFRKNINYLLRNHLKKASPLGLSQGKAWLKCQASLPLISGHCCLFIWCYLTCIW